MRKTRILALLLAMALLVSLTTACGGGDVDVGNNPTTTTSGSDVVDTTTTGGDETPDVQPSGSGSNNTPSSGNSNSGSGSVVTTTQPSGGSTDSGEGIKTSVTIKKGTTRVEEGVTFGGNKYKYAIGLPLTDSMKRQIAQFQIKYKCTLETTLLGFQTYVQDLAAKNAAGERFDILQVEGFRFPSIAITKLVEPLEDTITTADWYSTSAKAKGGFDEALTRNFVWNNHLYAVVPHAGSFSPQMMVLYYNKKLIKEAGADDPRELYEKGKWDWDAYYNLGTILVKNTNAFLTDSRTAMKIPTWNDAWLVDTSDSSHPKANITSSNYTNAYKYIQKLTLGQNKVVNVDLAGTNETPSVFFQGKVATWSGFYFDLYENQKVGDGVVASNAFGKSISNLGMVPVPLGPDNKAKTYPVGSYIYGIGVGVGSSDKRVAMAFAKFSATYKSSVKETYSWSAEDQALIDAMAAGPKLYFGNSFSDGSTSIDTLSNEMASKLLRGDDVAQVLNSYNARMQNCIDVTIAQQ